MEHIAEILRRQTQINTSRANTDIWSGAEAEEPSPGSACPICKGTGFVHPLLESGQADFDRVVPCRCRERELKEKKAEYLEKYSNLGSLSQLNFDNLSPKGRAADAISQERFARIYQAAKAFAEGPEGWLVFLGPSGCGKTHLACAIAHHRLSLGEPV